MPDLTFKALTVRTEPNALTPMLFFKLEVTNTAKNEPVNSVLLKCQINLDVHLRLYNENEINDLYELFGRTEQWKTSLRSFLWTHVTTILPSFEKSVEFELPVPCTYDFEIASSKYFTAIREGKVPISFLFSGSVFYHDRELADKVLVSQIPWDREASFELPIQIWRDAVENSFPDSRWLRVQNDTLRRLYEYKARKGVPTLDEALGLLMESDSKSSLPTREQ